MYHAALMFNVHILDCKFESAINFIQLLIYINRVLHLYVRTYFQIVIQACAKIL